MNIMKVSYNFQLLHFLLDFIHSLHADLNKRYGDIVMEVSNNVPVISIFNRHDIQKVLECPSKYPFRPPTEIVSYYRRSRPDRYASLGLVNEQGAQWAHLRSKLTPKTLVSRRVLGLFCPDLNEICDDFVNEIKQKRNCDDNILRDFDPIAKLMTLEAACCLILGRRNSLQEINDKNLHELGEASKKAFENMAESYFGEKFHNYSFEFLN
jgi:ecdysone 20-monooxygenase